jgi:hypothetical protein
MSTTNSPRKWPAGCGKPPTSDRVRDDQNRVWHLGDDGKYHDPSNRHHHTPKELHNRTDLEEVQ